MKNLKRIRKIWTLKFFISCTASCILNTYAFILNNCILTRSKILVSNESFFKTVDSLNFASRVPFSRLTVFLLYFPKSRLVPLVYKFFQLICKMIHLQGFRDPRPKYEKKITTNVHQLIRISFSQKYAGCSRFTRLSGLTCYQVTTP